MVLLVHVSIPFVVITSLSNLKCLGKSLQSISQFLILLFRYFFSQSLKRRHLPSELSSSVFIGSTTLKYRHSECMTGPGQMEFDLNHFNSNSSCTKENM